MYSFLTPIPNFIKIGQKTQKMRILAIGQFWLIGPVRLNMVVGVSNSFPVILSPFIATIPNFIQIGQKTGWAGRS